MQKGQGWQLVNAKQVLAYRRRGSAAPAALPQAVITDSSTAYSPSGELAAMRPVGELRAHNTGWVHGGPPK